MTLVPPNPALQGTHRPRRAPELGRWTAKRTQSYESLEVKFKRGSESQLRKKARRGFRGYPVATVAFYGPDDTRASKVAVGIVAAEGTEPIALERWVVEDGDARRDPRIGEEVLEFLRRHEVRSVAMTDRIIG